MNNLNRLFSFLFLKNNKKSVKLMTELIDFFDIFWFDGNAFSSVSYFNIISINGVDFT